MYSHTRKVGSLGRYGPRVGRKPKYEALKIEDEAKAQGRCRNCGRGKLRRTGAGIWTCRNCGFTFCGGAHIPVVKRVTVEEESQ